MFRTFFATALCLAGSALAQAVPTKVNFAGRIVDSGAPVTGSRDFVFKLFPTIVGGTEVWTETRMAVAVVDGAVNVDLGAQTPLTATILDGQTLYLEVSVGGTVLTPRTAVLSVPYALRSTVAAQVGTLTAAQIQQRVSSACGAGAAIQTINADGTVVCQAVGADDAGVTSITNITAGAGLSGGGSTGNVALAVSFAGTGAATTAGRSDHNHTGTYLPLGPTLACAATDRVVSINPTTGSVVCAAGSGLTSVGVTAPLTSTGGASPTIALGLCGTNEILKMIGAAWRCVSDDNSGGTVTSVNATAPLASSGGATPTLSLGVVPLANGGAGASLATTGGAGQFVKQSTAGAALSVGTIGPGDLPAHNHPLSQIGSPSTGGAGQVVKQTTAGGALTVGTLVTADLPPLPGTVQNWPAQPSCPAGQLVRAIGADGTPTCVTPILVDAYFNLTVHGPSTFGAAWISCFNTSCNIAAPGAYASGSSSGTIAVTRSGVGTYSVTFPWMPVSGTVPQISDYSGTANTHCRIVSFGGTSVSVQCFNAF